MTSYIQCDVPATLVDNLELILGHDIFIGYSNPLTNITETPLMSIFGPDFTRQFVILYPPDGCGTVVLKPSNMPQDFKDEDPFYMCIRAARDYREYYRSKNTQNDVPNFGT